jgi:hypothetical protein
MLGIYIWLYRQTQICVVFTHATSERGLWKYGLLFSSDISLNHHLNASKSCLYLGRRYDLDLLWAIRGVFYERTVIGKVSISLLWTYFMKCTHIMISCWKRLPISKKIIHSRMIFVRWRAVREIVVAINQSKLSFSFAFAVIIISFEAVLTVLTFQPLKCLHFLLGFVKLRRQRWKGKGWSVPDAVPYCCDVYYIFDWRCGVVRVRRSTT